MATRSLAYTQIGHGKSGRIWYYLDGNIVEHTEHGRATTHSDLLGIDTSKIHDGIMGRVDHTRDRVSLSVNDDPKLQRRMESVIKKLEREYPDYTLYLFIGSSTEIRHL